ncbi:MAG: hypothetical protein E7500_04780 [Ruminococcus sp.]|nr:hypothetical protein [Ruminococcus sp.]
MKKIPIACNDVIHSLVAGAFFVTAMYWGILLAWHLNVYISLIIPIVTVAVTLLLLYSHRILTALIKLPLSLITAFFFYRQYISNDFLRNAYYSLFETSESSGDVFYAGFIVMLDLGILIPGIIISLTSSVRYRTYTEEVMKEKEKRLKRIQTAVSALVFILSLLLLIKSR